MYRTHFLPLCAFALTISCSFEFRPDPPLAGTYQISATCQLVVGKAEATAACTGETTMTVRFDERSMTFENVELTTTEKDTECWVERTCTKRYTGTAERKRQDGSIYEGRFGQLGGEWSGALTLITSCAKEDAKSGAPDWCNKARKDRTYNFSAKVASHDAEITWSSSDGAEGSFSALETEGGVRVADTFYQRLGESGADNSAGKDSEAAKDGGAGHD
jgi:hypothetical protein